MPESYQPVTTKIGIMFCQNGILCVANLETLNHGIITAKENEYCKAEKKNFKLQIEDGRARKSKKCIGI